MSHSDVEGRLLSGQASMVEPSGGSAGRTKANLRRQVSLEPGPPLGDRQARGRTLNTSRAT